jgi:hypothetical protein
MIECMILVIWMKINFIEQGEILPEFFIKKFIKNDFFSFVFSSKKLE